MASKRKTYKKVFWVLNILLVGGIFISASGMTLSGYHQHLNKSSTSSNVTLALYCDSAANMNQGQIS